MICHGNMVQWLKNTLRPGCRTWGWWLKLDQMCFLGICCSKTNCQVNSLHNAVSHQLWQSWGHCLLLLIQGHLFRSKEHSCHQWKTIFLMWGEAAGVNHWRCFSALTQRQLTSVEPVLPRWIYLPLPPVRVIPGTLVFVLTKLTHRVPQRQICHWLLSSPPH